MLEFIDNQEMLCQRVDTLETSSTKFMHSSTTTLHFLLGRKEETKTGKVSEATHSLYKFLVEDWLNIMMEQPAKEEDQQDVEIPDKK